MNNQQYNQQQYNQQQYNQQQYQPYQQNPQMQPIYMRRPTRPYTPEMEAEANRKARDAFWIYTCHLFVIPITRLLELIGWGQGSRVELLFYHVMMSAVVYGPLICFITLILTLTSRDRYPENRKLKFVARYITIITIAAVALFVIALVITPLSK